MVVLLAQPALGEIGGQLHHCLRRIRPQTIHHTTIRSESEQTSFRTTIS